MNLENKLKQLTKIYFELKQVFENSDEDYDVREEFSANLKGYRELVPEINFGEILDSVRMSHEDFRPEILIMLEEFHKEVLFRLINRSYRTIV